MNYIEIICLANSRKYHNRCFAGKQVKDLKWVRPVGDTENGEISEEQMQLSDGNIPKVFDIIKMPIRSHQPLLYQPDNFLTEIAPWTKISVYDSIKIDVLCDIPNAVWYIKPFRDRIPLSLIKKDPLDSSLLLIKVNNFKIKKSSYKKQLRAIFIYKDTEYDLAITDIEIENEFGNKSSGEYTFVDYNIYLCISLGEPFKIHRIMKNVVVS